MILISAAVVVAALAMGMTIALVALPPSDPARHRLARLWRDSKTAAPTVTFRHKQKERAARVLQDVGKIMLPWSKDDGRTNMLLVRAGYRKPESALV